MRIKHKIAAALILLTFAKSAAQADSVFVSGNQFMSLCDEESPIVLGYVAGIDDHQTLLKVSNVGQPLYCTPEQAVITQLKDVACNYVRSHPAERHFAASTLVVMAFANAWPCK